MTPTSATPVPAGRRCRLCGTTGTKHLLRTRDNLVLVDDKRDFDIYFCESCEVAWTEPALSHDELAKYYPEWYGAYGTPRGLRGWLGKIAHHEDLRRIEALDTKGRRLFELGTGNGSFLAFAQRAGWTVAGREPSKAGRQAALTNHDLKIDAGWAEDLAFHCGYDVVVARHSLEHLDDPAGALMRIFRDGLVHGGMLYLKLPAIDGWEARRLGPLWRGWDAPRHRYHFTRAGIRKLLERTGFIDVSIRSEVAPHDWIESAISGRSRAGFLLKGFGTVANVLPAAAQLALGGCVAAILSPAGTGRMIVTARRP